jgi:hypothetical protein
MPGPSSRASWPWISGACTRARPAR